MSPRLVRIDGERPRVRSRATFWSVRNAKLKSSEGAVTVRFVFDAVVARSHRAFALRSLLVPLALRMTDSLLNGIAVPHLCPDLGPDFDVEDGLRCL